MGTHRRGPFPFRIRSGEKIPTECTVPRKGPGKGKGHSSSRLKLLAPARDLSLPGSRTIPPRVLEGNPLLTPPPFFVKGYSGPGGDGCLEEVTSNRFAAGEPFRKAVPIGNLRLIRLPTEEDLPALSQGGKVDQAQVEVFQLTP